MDSGTKTKAIVLGYLSIRFLYPLTCQPDLNSVDSFSLTSPVHFSCDDSKDRVLLWNPLELFSSLTKGQSQKLLVFDVSSLE